MIYNGDCLTVMKTFNDNHFTNILTDPPYGLSFMGKSWDHSVPGKEVWIEAFKICKPGAIMLCFGGTRTYHRLACAIEDAGWEVRDCLMWLYGSGFPKSHNHFGFRGYGTALKPAYEPILLCMKPLDGTFSENAENWGVAGINIDGSRIPTNNVWEQKCHDIRSGGWLNKKGRLDRISKSNSLGRWPANTLFDEQAAEMLDEQSGVNASRFFYCAKASSAERNKSCDNNHPTVKPIKLLEYLLKLIAPPKDALILDPFLGSGSTMLAAKNLGLSCEGIEISKEYCEIAKARTNL